MPDGRLAEFFTTDTRRPRAPGALQASWLLRCPQETFAEIRKQNSAL
jgi:hypothetical protein